MRPSRRPVLLLTIGICVIILAVVLSMYFGTYSMMYKYLQGTKWHLRECRDAISEYKEINGKCPDTLLLAQQYYEEKYSKLYVGLIPIRFEEFLSKETGNGEEHQELNGKGGWYYNNDTGEIRVNLTKPVKKYLKLYFGGKRNEIPAEW